jgi:hypothetical protein
MATAQMVRVQPARPKLSHSFLKCRQGPSSLHGSDAVRPQRLQLRIQLLRRILRDFCMLCCAQRALKQRRCWRSRSGSTLTLQTRTTS